MFIMDAPFTPPGLFCDAMNLVIERFQEAEKQAEAFKRYLPCQAHVSAGRKQSKSLTSSSYKVRTALSDEAS